MPQGAKVLYKTQRFVASSEGLTFNAWDLKG